MKRIAKLNQYNNIINEAEIKRKSQLIQIRQKCCPICENSGKDCLDLEHTIINGCEVYKCLNFLKRQ